MASLNKIVVLTLVLCYLALASVCVYGQKISSKPSSKNKVTVGFQSGRELLFNSSPLIHSKQSKVHYAISNTLVLRKPVTQHLKLDAGIKYEIPTPGTAFDKKLFGQKKYSSLSMPLSVEYYFLSENARVRPFIGTGVEYDLPQNATNISPFLSDRKSEEIPFQPLQGTRYINILFTQGVTFEINTRIEVSQSFHFIPGNSSKIIGVDIGIGYRLP